MFSNKVEELLVNTFVTNEAREFLSNMRKAVSVVTDRLPADGEYLTEEVIQSTDYISEAYPDSDDSLIDLDVMELDVDDRKDSDREDNIMEEDVVSLRNAAEDVRRSIVALMRTLRHVANPTFVVSQTENQKRLKRAANRISKPWGNLRDNTDTLVKLFDSYGKSSPIWKHYGEIGLDYMLHSLKYYRDLLEVKVETINSLFVASRVDSSLRMPTLKQYVSTHLLPLVVHVRKTLVVHMKETMGYQLRDESVHALSAPLDEIIAALEDFSEGKITHLEESELNRLFVEIHSAGVAGILLFNVIRWKEICIVLSKSDDVLLELNVDLSNADYLSSTIMS